MDRDKCIGCPLDGVVEPTPAILRGSARFLVVTDTPTEAAARRGLLLSRNSAEVFAAGMAAAGFQPDDFSYVAQIRCCFDEGTYTTTDRKLIARKCREHLVDDIVASRPEVIMPLGASAASQVAGRAVKITKVKGVASHNEEHECMVLPLLSPGQVVMYPQHTGAFNADCISLKRLVDSEYNVKAASESMLGDYELIDDLQFLIDMEPTIIAFDTENTGLDYFHRGTHDVREYDPAIHTSANFDPHAAILTMQFCVAPGKAYLLPWDHPEAPQSKRAKARLKRQLTQLLCRRNVRVIGQNLKYDVTYLYHQTGIRLKIGGDTLMLAAQVDENLQNKNLDALVKIYVPELAGYADHFNATVDKSRMWEQPLHRLVGYGAGDADAALRVYKALIKIVQADKGMLANYRHVSLPGLNAFASMELRGVPVDYEALLEFEKVMAASVAEQEANLLRQVPNSIKRLHVDKGAKKGESGCKFSRSAFVQDILFKHPDGFRLTPKVFTKTTERLEPAFRVPSTSSKDHLPYFFDECPFTQELATYVKDERLLNTSVRGFKNKYIFDDLVRSIYSLWTAVTGRSASERPNGQNYPNRGKTAKAYRRIFIAPEGYFVLVADLSQAELRIAADMSRDPVMCRIYQEAGDIHTATALIIMGVTAEEFAALPKEVRSDFRTKAKATNFGFIYGMWWRKFVGYAKTQYGVEFTDRQAEKLRSDFFKKYAKLVTWHEQMKAFARKHKFVRSYSGRIRHLPMIDSDDDGIRQEAERQAVNCLSDDTEILTLRGWRTVDALGVGDRVYSVNPATGTLEVDAVQAIHTGMVDGSMLHLEGNAISAVATPNHRWLTSQDGQGGNKGKSLTRFRTSQELSMLGDHKLWVACDGLSAQDTTWHDDEVRLLGWVLTDGYYLHQYSPKTGKEWGRGRVGVTQTKPQNIMEIDALFRRLGKHSFAERDTGQHVWVISHEFAARIIEEMPEKTLTAGVLSTMSSRQHRLLFETMLKGDGCWDAKVGRYRRFCAGSEERANAFLQLCVLIGQPAHAFYKDAKRYTPKKYPTMRNVPVTDGCWLVELKQRKRAQPQYGARWSHWAGRVWCPTTRNGTWVAKRKGKVFITGNSPVQGFGSDLGIMTLGRLNEEVDDRYLAPIAFVHDAIYALVPKKYLLWGARTLKWYMESNPLYEWFGTDMMVPIVADVSFGRNFGDTYEMAGLTLDDSDEYDFSKFWDAEKESGIIVPTQSAPPNNGALTFPVYTVWEP